uniref:TnpM n=1 Tax=Klebsiella oxytoca KOX105 TaxID=795470 RepID=D7RU22_KLEOX|nr:TnpM [Klebsiella oxytoca KOX105]
MRCRPSLVRGRAAQVNPGGFTTPARRPSVPHRTAGCGKSSLRPLMAGSSPSLPDGSNPSAAIVQSASDVQCSRLLKTTCRTSPKLRDRLPLSFSEGDCTSSLGWPPCVHRTSDRERSEVLCTKRRERSELLRTLVHGATKPEPPKIPAINRQAA